MLCKVFPEGIADKAFPAGSPARSRYFFTDNRGGVALILVIWVMVILVAIVGEFSYSMRTALSKTSRRRKRHINWRCRV
ncbi:MAG: hypothetical protein GXP46_06910 [Deferribacteres bacterium]|nr:hypothetical protein [Deferribacteres bacterium]